MAFGVAVLILIGIQAAVFVRWFSRRRAIVRVVMFLVVAAAAVGSLGVWVALASRPEWEFTVLRHFAQYQTAFFTVLTVLLIGTTVIAGLMARGRLLLRSGRGREATAAKAWRCPGKALVLQEQLRPRHCRNTNSILPL